MKSFVLSVAAVVSLIFSLSAFAQEPRPAQVLAVDSVHRPFDVTSYDLTLDWRNIFEQKSHNFTGVNKIQLTATGTANELLLDAAFMHIDQIVVNGARLSVDVQPDANEQLHIPIALTPGQHWQIEISYTHQASDNQGLYFFPKGLYVGQGPGGDSVFTTEDVAYTMSEPLDAHKWMPCMDRPYDKATSKIAIRVPGGISAQSNGLLDKIDTLPDGSMTYYWSNNTPISTYLMVADASTFIEWTTWYTRVSDTTQKVPVYNYAWPSDYNQTDDKSGFQYNAQWALRNTPRMMAAFSERFGEYPFVKYGMVPVQKFDFGGMEHQTLTTINRSWLRGWYEDGIAHELMHQWFGDKTTCATWSDIWLNEGFASYGEAVWEESANGPGAYLNVVRNQANGFFNPRSWESNTIPVYDPPISNVFNYPTTYAKGSCVLHMLRRALDDDTLFFNTLRDYSNTFAFTTATTEQFANYIAGRIGTRSPIDLRDYIDEWIMTGGYPVYNITWASGSNGWLVIKIEQQQSSRSYSMPLRFTSNDATAGDAQNFMLVDTARSQIFKVKLPSKATALVMDTSAAILTSFTVNYDVNLEALSVGQPNEAMTTIDRSSDGWIVSVADPVGGRMQLTDVLGKVVLAAPFTSGNGRIRIASNRLPHGVFWGRIENGAKISTFKIEN